MVPGRPSNHGLPATIVFNPTNDLSTAIVPVIVIIQFLSFLRLDSSIGTNFYT